MSGFRSAVGSPRAAPGLARLVAHDEPGLHVRAGDVHLDRRDLVAHPNPLDQSHEAGKLGAITDTHNGTGRPGRLGQILAQKALEPLLGSPIRLITPANLVQARWPFRPEVRV